MRTDIAAVLALAVLLAACSTTAETAPDPGCANVVAAELRPSDGGFTATVTVASADTGWEKYADAWEVRSLDGDVLGTRTLAHPHVDEQPFTRSLSAIAIPSDVDRVEIAARDSVEGFCGDALVVDVPRG